MTTLYSLSLGVPAIFPKLGGVTELIGGAGFGRVAEKDSDQCLAKTVSSDLQNNSAFEEPDRSKPPIEYTASESARATPQVYQEAIQMASLRHPNTRVADGK